MKSLILILILAVPCAADTINFQDLKVQDMSPARREVHETIVRRVAALTDAGIENISGVVCEIGTPCVELPTAGAGFPWGRALTVAAISAAALTTAKLLLGGDRPRIINPIVPPQPTPEPATVVLLAAGLAGLAVRKRRKTADEA